MMRVVTSEFVTLEGVSEDPGGVEDSPIGDGLSATSAARRATAPPILGTRATLSEALRARSGSRSEISDGWGATAFIALDRNGATATSNEVT